MLVLWRLKGALSARRFTSSKAKPTRDQVQHVHRRVLQPRDSPSSSARFGFGCVNSSRSLSGPIEGPAVGAPGGCSAAGGCEASERSTAAGANRPVEQVTLGAASCPLRCSGPFAEIFALPSPT